MDLAFLCSLFTRAEVQRLKHLTLYDVIMAVTRMDIGDMQENPFLSPSSGKQIDVETASTRVINYSGIIRYPGSTVVRKLYESNDSKQKLYSFRADQ